MKSKSPSIETWEKELEKLSVVIYPGELSHAIHGWLFDPDKLKAFISTLLSQAEAKGARELADKLLKEGHGGGNWRRLITVFTTKDK